MDASYIGVMRWKIDETNCNTFADFGAAGLDHAHLRELMRLNGWRRVTRDALEAQVTRRKRLGDARDARADVEFVWTELTARMGFDPLSYNVTCAFKNLYVAESKRVVTDKGNLHKYMAQQHPRVFAEHFAHTTLLRDLSTARPMIVRPVGKDAYAGIGVRVVASAEDIARAQSEMLPTCPDAIASEYILDPLLWSGHKMHLRMYWLVTCGAGDCSTISTYLWHRGKILTAAEPYVAGQWSSRAIHDSHAKSTPKNLYFPEDLNDPRVCADADSRDRFAQDLLAQMREILDAVSGLFEGNLEAYPESNEAFEVFGCDFMVDMRPQASGRARVVVLEINERIGMQPVPGDKDLDGSYARFSRSLYNWVYELGIAPIRARRLRAANSKPIVYLTGDRDRVRTGGAGTTAQAQDTFPYKRLWLDESKYGPRACFMRLREYIPTYRDPSSHALIVNLRTNQSAQMIAWSSAQRPPRAPRKERLGLILREEDYLMYDIISDWYIEDIRVRAMRTDARISPYDYWKSIEGLASVRAMTLEERREFVYRNCHEVGTFHPTIASAMVQLVRARTGTCDNVLDPCAGWGDRLIGFLAAGARHITCVDPHTLLHQRYERMRDDLVPLCPMRAEHTSAPRARFVCAPFEECTPEQVGTAHDLVMTSPPYFDTEIYTNEATQSIARYRRFGAWYRDFLIVMCARGAATLRAGGVLAIVINNSYSAESDSRITMNFAADVSNACAAMGFALTFIGLATYEVRTKKVLKSAQPIWLWQRA